MSAFPKSFAVTRRFALTRVLNTADISLFPGKKGNFFQGNLGGKSIPYVGYSVDISVSGSNTKCLVQLKYFFLVQLKYFYFA